MPDPQTQRPRVGLFVTCLVDLFRPAVGFAAVKLIEDAGCRVEVPAAQNCCGQPAYNTGDRGDARAIAENTILAFEGFDYVVAPSGSCAAMLKRNYPALFADDAGWQERANAFAAKVYELTSFLVDVCGVATVDARVDGSVTYHDACAGLRDLGIEAQPRRLLSAVKGLTLKEIPGAGVCCGIGNGCNDGRAAARKTEHIRAAGAGTLLAGDLGCLMHIAGRLKREGSAVEVRHVAEVLAGMNDTPPIGGPGQPARAMRRYEQTGEP